MKTNQLFKLATAGLTLFNIALLAPPESGQAVEAISPRTSGDNIAYMTVYSSADFGTIDLATGAFTPLGNSGQTLAGLGVVNSTLYAPSYHTNPGNLYTVNPANGDLTLVGSSAISYDMFGSNTQGLYAIGTDANLYSINSTTGAATLIGPIGVSFGSWRNLSCNASVLYLANGANLYTLNTTTGAATLIGNMGGPQVGAMLLEGGILYAGEETPNFRVDMLDPNTGIATTGPNVTGVSSGVFGGLAPYPLPVPGCVMPPANLISWWPGDGNANDIQNGNNGTLQGGATFAPGKIEQAFSFSSTSDDVLVPHSDNQNTGAQISVDAWVLVPNSFSGTTTLHIVNKQTPNVNDGYRLEIVNAGQPNALNFEIITGDGLFFIQVQDVITPGVWQHLAGTYDGLTLRIYVNGVEVGNSPASGSILPVTGDLMIGLETGQSTPWLLDEVDLFDRALSQSEIQEIYNAGSAGKCKASATPTPTPTATPTPTPGGRSTPTPRPRPTPAPRPGTQ
jgi:hypothetical protein